MYARAHPCFHFNVYGIGGTSTASLEKTAWEAKGKGLTQG